MCPPNSSLSQNRCQLLNPSRPPGGFSIHACRMRHHCNTSFPVLTRELLPKRMAWESEYYRGVYSLPPVFCFPPLPRRDEVIASQLFPIGMLVSGTEHIPGPPKVSPQEISEYARRRDNNDCFKHKMVF